MRSRPDQTGEAQRNPRRSSPTYAVRAPLAGWLRREAGEATARWPDGYRVLDVGCGIKPYRPFFDAASEYIGVDLDNPTAEVQAPADALPFEDGTFELVLCTQVLEHSADPGKVVSELRRVTAPGGRVLASTHGVQVYHPAPLDLWRWTHTGLERLFRANGDWSKLDVSPGGGTAACVGMVVSTYVDLIARRARVRPLAGPLVAALNSGGELLDRRSRGLREPQPGSLFANLHVRADA